jgi:hypothetical protein
MADKTREEAITLAFCWAHLRRQFFDIAKDGQAPVASEALERIAKHYLIEKTIRGQTAAARPSTTIPGGRCRVHGTSERRA